MGYRDKIGQIDQLQNEIERQGKIPDEVLKKINYGFRLDWNYTSNSMEGNSLTRSETRSVMIGNITVEGKPLKDILEIKGHDEVVKEIIKAGQGEINISEKRIKDIHKGIMSEEDPAKKNLPGNWKTSNSYLINYKNERIDFVAHPYVPERMHKLVNWLNDSTEKIKRKVADALHPAILSFRFHLDFVSIHPFYDGNGRTARILNNIILIANGFPPVYIAENERNAYYRYLADIQGYGGEPDMFYDFMAGLLLRSQQIVLDAIRTNGDSISG